MEDELVGLTKDEVQMAVQAANLDADSDYQSKPFLSVQKLQEGRMLSNP